MTASERTADMHVSESKRSQIGQLLPVAGVLQFVQWDINLNFVAGFMKADQ